MGSSAKAFAWVGIREEDCDVLEVLRELPVDLFEEWDTDDFYAWPRGYFWTEAKMEVTQKYGVVLDTFKSSDEHVGAGVQVFDHDWDDGNTAFNPEELLQKIVAARSALQQLFDKFGITEPIGVWFQTDYR